MNWNNLSKNQTKSGLLKVKPPTKNCAKSFLRSHIGPTKLSATMQFRSSAILRTKINNTYIHTSSSPVKLLNIPSNSCSRGQTERLCLLGIVWSEQNHSVHQSRRLKFLDHFRRTLKRKLLPSQSKTIKFAHFHGLLQAPMKPKSSHEFICKLSTAWEMNSNQYLDDFIHCSMKLLSTSYKHASRFPRLTADLISCHLRHLGATKFESFKYCLERQKTTERCFTPTESCYYIYYAYEAFVMCHRQTQTWRLYMFDVQITQDYWWRVFWNFDT